MKRKVVFEALTGLILAFYFKKEHAWVFWLVEAHSLICMLTSYLNQQINILKSIAQTPQSCEQHKSSCLTSLCQLINSALAYESSPKDGPWVVVYVNYSSVHMISISPFQNQKISSSCFCVYVDKTVWRRPNLPQDGFCLVLRQEKLIINEREIYDQACIT
jgi:hypothetical protein